MAKDNKATKVRNFIENNPDWGNKDIAAQLGVSQSYVWIIRRQIAHNIGAVAPTEAPKPTSANDIQMGGDHYKQHAVQPWDVFDTWPTEQRIGAYRANCTKYVMRLDSKDTPLLNAQKLAHYAQKLVEVLEQAQ